MAKRKAAALLAAGPFGETLAAAIAREARRKAAAEAGDAVKVAACVFDRQGHLLGRADA